MNAIAKVCGLTRADDVARALDAGADLLGFVHHPSSPRHCTDVSALARMAGTRGVLVMVAEDADEILALLPATSIRRVQPYLPAASRRAGVARLRDHGYEILLPWPDAPDQPVVDADLYIWETAPAQTGVHGGSGQAHAAAFPPPGPFLLAGGIDAENVDRRAAQLRSPELKNLRGFDAASRLESGPGIKDPTRLERFVKKVHDHAI